MGNKTISLNEVCEGILKEWKKDPAFTFSGWIAARMTQEYGKGQAKLTDKNFIPPEKRGQPTSKYICNNCKVSGHHWERDCPFPTPEERLLRLRVRAAMRGEEE